MTKRPLVIAKDLALPLDAATTTGAICGIRGSGKTNTAVVLVEELLDAGQQCVIFDPTDVWYGLKSSKNGKSAGYPVVVLGGKRGDLPLSSDDGAVIADFIVDNPALSIVLALRHFESKAQEQRFVTDCCRRLYFRKGQQDSPSPVTLLFDEASRHVPQMVRGEDAACVGAVQQIVRQGRSSGFGVVLIDQRPATVNKDVLAQLETLIMHRITSPQDRKALTAWIEQHDTHDAAADFLGTLAALRKGEAWIWSPEFLDIFERVQIRERRTFDSSYTPKIGERRTGPQKLADVDLQALRAKLAQTIEEARENDVDELKAKIANLEHALDDARNSFANLDDEQRAPSADDLAKEYERGHSDGEVLTIQRFRTQLGDVIEQAARAAAAANGAEVSARAIADEMQRLLDDPSTPPAKTFSVSRADILERGRSVADVRAQDGGLDLRAVRSRKRDDERGDGKLGPGERLILSYIAQQPMTREHISVAAGYKKTSRDVYLRRLAAAGLIEADADRFKATRAGVTALGPDYEKLPRGRALFDYWMRKLPEGEAKILKLIAQYPGGVDREKISAVTGYKKTSRDVYIRRLRARQLVGYTSDGRICLSPVLTER